MPRRLNPTLATVNAFRRALPRWYRLHRRDLPWRRACDPYHIWVSEIMLQQTRVATVLDYYARWISEFPTITALARAPADRVMKRWEGLGYYSRARNLHRAAKLCRGRVPQTFAALCALPGIGPYTGAAIASIAFSERVPVVDGNVARVLARVFGITENVKLPATLKRMFALAEQLMPARHPGDFNQAMMELGALVCTPARPLCEGCPLRRVCVAHARGLTERLPNRGPSATLVPVTLTAACVCRGGRVLIVRRPARGLLAGLWELPAAFPDAGPERFRLSHTITNRRITLRVVDGPAAPIPPGVRRRWIRREDLRQLSFPAAQRLALQRIFSAQDENGTVGVCQQARENITDQRRG